MSDYSNAIVLIDPLRAVEEARNRRNIVVTLRSSDILREGVDFGVVPGTSKPTLLKPGAERLCAALGLNPRFELLNKVENWDTNAPLFHYQYVCHLIHIETGRELATGVGSCNSMEAKYRWRKADLTCPVCGKATIIKGKAEYGGGWLCFTKKGGCGAKFPDGDESIESQPVGNVPNDDVFSLVNTIDKMAQKRALIAAVLIGANASEFFTQDVEDIPGFGVDVVEGQFTEVKPDQREALGNGNKRRIEGEGRNGKTHFSDFRRVKAFVGFYREQGLTDGDLLAALNVERLSAFPGTEAEAHKAVAAYIEKKAAQP